MKIYILTRFSIPCWPTLGAFCWSKELYSQRFPNIVAYNAWLYDEKRLQQRIEIFETITRYSIESQTYENYEWIFYIGKGLPSKYKNYLSEINKSKLFTIDKYTDINYENFHSSSKEGYISIRLDDDDALHPTYLEKIKDFNKPNEIIAPLYGKYFNLLQDRKIQAHSVNNKKTIKACGVGVYNKNIHCLNNHTKFHKKFPIYFIEDKDMFFVSVGEHTSVNRKLRKETFNTYNNPKDLFNNKKSKYEST
jgi:hypothetical protein